MYRVMLIDDEKWVVKSLKSSIDWHAFGFEIVAEAFNGEEGCRKIKELAPDLVFIDIRMPGLDGLEVMRRIGEWNRDVSFVVTTGYKEFDYAKKAIQYGALDYCLKPYDEEEIVEVLRKYRRKLQAQGANLQIELLHLLQENDSSSYPRIEAVMRSLGLSGQRSAGITALVAVGAGSARGHSAQDGGRSAAASLPELAGLPHLALQTGVNKRLYLIEGDCSAPLYEMFSASLPAGIAGMGIGACARDLGALIQAIGDANTAAYQFFVTGGSVCSRAVPQESKESRLEGVKERLRQLNRTQNTAHIGELTAMVAELCASGSFTARSALTLYQMVLSGLYQLEEEQLMTYEELVLRFGDLEGLTDYIQSLLSAHYSPALPEKEPNSTTFQRIVAFVDEHFREDISLQSVSEKLDLNMSYISQLFRKEGADTFLQYLTKKRIAYACELLANTQATVQNISELAGYMDYFHFAKTFKRSTGQTATQYRETHSQY